MINRNAREAAINFPREIIATSSRRREHSQGGAQRASNTFTARSEQYNRRAIHAKPLFFRHIVPSRMSGVWNLGEGNSRAHRSDRALSE